MHSNFHTPLGGKNLREDALMTAQAHTHTAESDHFHAVLALLWHLHAVSLGNCEKIPLFWGNERAIVQESMNIVFTPLRGAYVEYQSLREPYAKSIYIVRALGV